MFLRQKKRYFFVDGKKVLPLYVTFWRKKILHFWQKIGVFLNFTVSQKSIFLQQKNNRFFRGFFVSKTFFFT